jgi:fucose 4-O-acetylase-like acetyltransferase
MNQRNESIDVARALLILYIVSVIHAMYWLGDFNSAWRSALLFEMPAIFILSGCSFGLSPDAAKPLSISTFIQHCARRGWRVLLPYWVYAIFCILLMVMLGHWTSADVPPVSAKCVGVWLDPIRHGSGCSYRELNYHVWFIPVFLLVSFLLPLFSRLRFPVRLPLAVWALCVIGVLEIARQSVSNETMLKAALNVISYSAWATFGLSLGRGFVASSYQYLGCLVLALAALLYMGVSQVVSLDMQSHKFPPDAVFFIFGTAWISLFALISKNMNPGLWSRLSGQPWLRPFIRSGYSIYLWQGAAYTLATALRDTFQLSIASTMLVAIIGSVGFGLIAAPIENIKLPRWKPSPSA